MNDYLKIALSVCIAATVIVSGTIIFALVNQSEDNPIDDVLISFSSRDDLGDFLKSSEALSDEGTYYYANPKGESLSDASSSYSSTNVQVAGVDEADIVKTDGEYIYVATSSTVSVIKAYPSSEMENAFTIDVFGLSGYSQEDYSIYISGLYLFENKLVVMWNLYYHPYWDYYADNTDYFYTMISNQYSMVSVIDVSDAYTPEFEFSCGVSGYGLTSRMIDGNLYLVAQMYAWLIDDTPYLPHLWVDGVGEEFAIDDILFDPDTPDASSYINLLSVDISSGANRCKAIMAGYASVVYMSMDALYVTIPKWTGNVIALDTLMSPAEELTARTSIYRIVVDDLSMVVAAGGEVKGWLLNQFSMDEHDGFLRVATTTSWLDPENAVYILDSDLDIVGSLEHIAPTERIFSARYLGETLFLVTFLQVDPLFIIDLSDVSSPEIIGELKVPGFSTYLHPVGADHVLGIGSENGSVKVTLFDVSDHAAPVEQSTFLVGDSSWSIASYDHKAVLFDLEKELLVLPICMFIDESEGTYSYWAGAYVFTVSLIDGISLKGSVTNDDVYAYAQVKRSLYIDDSLYTISDYSVKASSLTDLSEEAFLVYRADSDHYLLYAEGALT